MNIILSGFKAVGKTTIGKLYSAKYSFNFVDTDDLLINYHYNPAVKDIGQLYKIVGEHKFRLLEHAVINKLSEQLSVDRLINTDNIIALGGGTLLDIKNYDLLKHSGLIVYLEQAKHTVVERIKSLPVIPELFKSKINDRNTLDQVLDEYYINRSEIYKKHCTLSLNTEVYNSFSEIVTALHRLVTK